MMRIRLAPQGRADLDEVWLQLTHHSGSNDAAVRAARSIADACALIARFPYIGKELRSELRSNYRSFSVNKFVIFYSVKPNEIRLLRILPASREAATAFAEE
jgi:plasmid stabilization system protein ParE